MRWGSSLTIPILAPGRFLVDQSRSLETLEDSSSYSRRQLILLAIISGVITEFIGATFLIIYRSTINQAIQYTESLERVNSVGMAIQILDSVSLQAEKESVQVQEQLIYPVISIIGIRAVWLIVTRCSLWA